MSTILNFKNFLPLIILLNFAKLAYSNKVIELSDKFLEIYNNTSKSWLIKFYSNSCHRCKKLEADYMHVAQELHNEELNIIVSKIDIYKCRSVAKYFNIDETPTILYIDKTKIVKYENNKYKGDIIDFVKRMMGDQIRVLNSCEQINQLTQIHESSFVYFNEISSIEYNELASEHIKNTWFYISPLNCFGFDKNGIYSIKRSLTNTPYITKYDSDMRITLKQWVNFMHYPKFINMTIDNFDKLLDTKKMIVIALVKKYVSINRFISPNHKFFLEMFEKVAHLFLDDYFLFGWTSEFEMIKNIAIYDFKQLPSLIVLDSSNYEYYHEPGLTNSTQPEIVRYLEQIKMGKNLQRNGGNTIIHKIQRKLFAAKNKFQKMYNANPLMTFLLLALPSTILLTLCCGCLRTWSTDEEDEEQQYLLNKQQHQKID